MGQHLPKNSITVAATVTVSTCVCRHQHDRLLQAWDGPQQLHLVLFFHGIGNAIRVDDIAVQTLRLQPYMVTPVGEPPKLGFQ